MSKYRCIFGQKTQEAQTCTLAGAEPAGSQPALCPPRQARVILEKATKVSFKQVDDLASVWCECGELELRHENYDQALRLLRVSTSPGWGWGWGCVYLALPALSPCRRLPTEGHRAACSPRRVL